MRRWAFVFLCSAVATGVACSAFSGSDRDSSSDAGGPVADDGGSGGVADGSTTRLDSSTDDGGLLGSDASPGPPDGGGVAIDCSKLTGVVFCNDFDGHGSESPYTLSNSKMDAGISGGHTVSKPGALYVDTSVYAIFQGSPAADVWTVAFDVYLDASTPPNTVFADVVRTPYQVTFMSTGTGFKANQTIFTTPSGWTHVVVQRLAGGTTVSAGGSIQPVSFGASTSALELHIGNFGAPTPLWFDDVLAVSP